MSGKLRYHACRAAVRKQREAISAKKLGGKDRAAVRKQREAISAKKLGGKDKHSTHGGAGASSPGL